MGESRETTGPGSPSRHGIGVAIIPGMKRIVGAFLAALVGIHCSAPTDAPESASAESEITSPAAPNENKARPAAPADPAAPVAPPSEPVVPELAGLVRSGVAPHVTSTITDASGALYATGTFIGNVRIGSFLIKSRGDKDVFLLKLDAERQLQWVRAVGSASLESAPRIDLEETKVTVVGMTKGNGDMDCGSGPLQQWSSETFFLCIFGGEDGKVLSGGVFPTGAP